MYVFKEKQVFRKKFTFLLLVAICLFSIYLAFKYALERTDNMNAGQFFSLLFPVAIAFLIGNITLRTKIDHIGIHYQFFPFHLKYRLVKWSEIDQCFVRDYNPITEFGGWGYRVSIFRKKGIAFSVKGNTGLQILLKNGKKILIGTQNKLEMEQVLNTYKEKTNT